MIDAIADSSFQVIGGVERRRGWLVDLTSFIRNGESLRETLANGGSLWHYAGSFSTPLTVFGALGGALMAWSGTSGTLRTLEEIQKAEKEGDAYTANLLRCTSLPASASYATLGYAFVTMKVAILAKAAFAAMAADCVLTVSAGLMSASLCMKAIHGLYEAELLSKEIKEGEKTKEQFVQELQKKVKTASSEAARLERQTDKDCVKLVKGDGNKIEATVFEGIEKANYQAKIRYRLLLLVSILGLIALGVSTAFTGGLGSLLYMGGAILWMGLDSDKVSQRIGDWFWEHHKGRSGKSDLVFVAETAAAVLTSPVWAIPALLYCEEAAGADKPVYQPVATV